MTLEQVMLARPGEIVDLNSADAIQHGAKQKHEITTIDEFLKLG